MHNDIIALAVDNHGSKIALADQTGVMIVDMQNNSIEKVVEENFSQYKYSSYKMGFDDIGTYLFYTSGLTNALKRIPVSPETNDLNQLEAYFRFKGVCKNISNPEKNIILKDMVHISK